MYIIRNETCLKKRKRKNFSFFSLIFLFFKRSYEKNIINHKAIKAIKKRDLVTIWRIKIHGTLAITATVPLLNLNLNYEKLHCKYNDN